MGVFESGFRPKIPLRELLYKEGTLIGSNSYGFFDGKDEFETALEILKAEIEKFRRLITHIVPLSEFRNGLDLVRNRDTSGAIKVVFKT